MATLSNMQQRLLKLALNILYWAVFIYLCDLLSSSPPEGWESELPTFNFTDWLLWNMPFKWLIFYTYFYYFIPRFLEKKTGRFITVSLLIIAAYTTLKVWLDQTLGMSALYFVNISIPPENPEALLLVDGSLRLITVLGNILMAIAIRIGLAWFRNIGLKQQMQVLKLQSELDMLRNQVNPHFLFNTLNNIDGMVYKVSPEASEAIGRLASTLRYMLYESNEPTVSLEKELNYLKDYFALQRLRFRNPEVIQLIVAGDPTGVRIAPLLFIPFIENAFKHGEVQQNGILLRCKFQIEQNKVVFSMENGQSSTEAGNTKVGGIGMENIHRRLAMLYPNKYTLHIRPGPPVYHVELNIQTT